MKQIFGCIAILFLTTTFAQSSDPLTAFDFWVGEWEATWTGPNNQDLKGTNIIAKTTGGKVIQENFTDPNNNFIGTSISVYSTKDSLWHQAWADNSGGYINLIGTIDGDKRIFTTLPQTKNGQTLIYRMVFYEIKEDSFTWDWEVSTDYGLNWTLSWQIHYRRIK